MTDFLAFTVVGLFTGAAYAIAAGGLVLVYATTRVFNLAHGAFGMVMSFVFWQLSVDAGLPAVVALLLVVGVIAPLGGLLIERVLAARAARRAGQREPGRHRRAVRRPGRPGAGRLAAGRPGRGAVLPRPGADRWLLVSYHQLLTMALAVVVAVACTCCWNAPGSGSRCGPGVDDPAAIR